MELFLQFLTSSTDVNLAAISLLGIVFLWGFHQYDKKIESRFRGVEESVREIHALIKKED